MKDISVEEVLTNLTTKDVSLTGINYELYYWWMASTWLGVPMIFLNNDGNSVTTKSGAPNYGLLWWAFLISGWPFLIQWYI